MKHAWSTHITLQIFVPRVRFHADEVAEHARHDVVAKDDDLLPEELQPARVARQVDLGDFGPQAGREGGEQRLAGQDRVDGQVQRARDEDEVRAAGY
jgi:hypothetical protein